MGITAVMGLGKKLLSSSPALWIKERERIARQLVVWEKRFAAYHLLLLYSGQGTHCAHTAQTVLVIST